MFMAGVSAQLTAFNNYRTVEKPGKFEEKGNLEVLLFSLQSKMRANNQKVFTPKEGKLLFDINKVSCMLLWINIYSDFHLLRRHGSV